MPFTLRYEIFTTPELTEPTLDFYKNVMRFEVIQEKPSYIYLKRDHVTFAIVQRSDNVNTSFRAPPHGIELVLETNDVYNEFVKVMEKANENIANKKWDVVARIETQEWGLRDFRLSDPAGYYLRITERTQKKQLEV